LDKCGLFEAVKIDNANFDNLTVDDKVKFKKKSPHFTKYKLTILYGDNHVTVLVSGTQLTSERNGTIKTFEKVNKTIKRLEDDRKFKRAS
jgi:hypothetical protein